MKNLTTVVGLCLGSAVLPAASAYAQGDRLFGAERFPTLSGSGGAELHSADLNDDGHADLVVLENGEGGFSVHLGDGNGGFSLLGSHTFLSGSQSLQLADVSGDGIVDVLVREAFQQGSTLTLFLGTGGGAFGPGQTSNFGLSDVDDIRIADVNDDGLPDLIAMTFDEPAFTNILNVLPGLPAGSPDFFGAPATFSFPAFATREIAVLDVNADDAPDIVITAGSSDNTHQVFLNDGAGAFAPTAQGALQAGGSLLSRTRAEDLDGDGHVDLVYATRQFSEGISQIGVLPGDGTGTFGAPVLTEFGRSSLLSVLLADFNGDGEIDVAGPNFINDALVWLPGNGDLTFASPTFAGSGGAPFDAVVLDADEDGIDDLIVLNISSDDFTVHKGTGGDDFFETPRVNMIGAGATAVAVGDLTGDGLAEVVTANSTAGTLSVLSRLTGTVFDTGFEVSDGIADPIDVQIADVNGDNQSDVVVADRIQDAVLVLAGDGSSALAAPVVLPACNAPTRVGVADTNGDDQVDIVAACIGSNDIAVMLGDGVGGFGAASIFPAVNEPQNLILADVNDD
ncbi:MAG: VCBS repeat-containing protein, partial [Pseudomonadota bacterium]